MDNRLIAHLNSNYIITKSIVILNEKHSNYMALLQLVDDISQELD